MGTQIRRFALLLFIAAISINFALYSSQSYSPPRAESKSYSVMNCPSHEGAKTLASIVQFFANSDEGSGSEKHCFCYSCCNPRGSHVLTTQSAVLNPDKYASYLAVLIEITYTEKLYGNLPIRSPPSLLS
jgi:hypothetical protein